MPLYLETTPRPPMKATRTLRASLGGLGLLGITCIGKACIGKALIDDARIDDARSNKARAGDDSADDVRRGGAANFLADVTRAYTSSILCRCSSGSCFARTRARPFAPIFSLRSGRSNKNPIE